MRTGCSKTAPRPTVPPCGCRHQSRKNPAAAGRVCWLCRNPAAELTGRPKRPDVARLQKKKREAMLFEGAITMASPNWRAVFTIAAGIFTGSASVADQKVAAKEDCILQGVGPGVYKNPFQRKKFRQHVNHSPSGFFFRFCRYPSNSSHHIEGRGPCKPHGRAAPDGDRNHWILPAVAAGASCISHFRGSLVSVRPMRLVIRIQWVSQTTAGLP